MSSYNNFSKMFHANFMRFSVPVERVETAISNLRVKSLKVGLKIAVTTHSAVTSEIEKELL